METLIEQNNKSKSTTPNWGAVILTESKELFKFRYSSEVEDIEFISDAMLTYAGMLISEESLKDIWVNEDDSEWAQYLTE